MGYLLRSRSLVDITKNIDICLYKLHKLPPGVIWVHSSAGHYIVHLSQESKEIIYQIEMSSETFLFGSIAQLVNTLSILAKNQKK